MGLDAVALHDELLSAMPEGARHDSDLCFFCTADKAAQASPAPVPSDSSSSGASIDRTPTPEGGTPHTMSDTISTISTETHAALLEKAVKDATSTTENALARKVEEATALSAQVSELQAEKASLTTDNERLNKELDTAQVSLKNATDEVASLKADNAAKDEAARKADIASKRAEQVTNLNLFPKDYVTEKASKWADVSDEDWAERIEEWKQAKPATTSTTATTTGDTASAMTGTAGDLTKDVDSASKPIPARRAALGLNS